MEEPTEGESLGSLLLLHFQCNAQPWSHDPGTCWAHTQMCAGSFPCRALKVICEDEEASPQHAGDIWLRLVNSELQWYTWWNICTNNSLQFRVWHCGINLAIFLKWFKNKSEAEIWHEHQCKSVTLPRDRGFSRRMQGDQRFLLPQTQICQEHKLLSEKAVSHPSFNRV